MIALAKPMLGIEEKTLVSEVLSSGKLAHGEYVGMFERDFALFQGSKHCVATSSSTSAFHVALLSLGIKPGDKVITTLVHPGLTEQEVDYIVSSLQKYE